MRRSTIRLPLAVAASLIGAVAAVMTGRPEAALVAAPWVVLLLVGLTSRPAEGVQVTVDLDRDRIVVGDEAHAEIGLSSRTPGWVEVRSLPDDTFRGGVGPSSEDLRYQAAAVDSQAPATMRFAHRADHWGAHDLGVVDIRFHEPYGLFERSYRLHQPTNVRVHPTDAEVRSILRPGIVRRLPGAHRSLAAGPGLEFADIRPFDPGDSLRDINWRASARSDDIWVSQRHPESSTDVIMLLDSFVESGHDVRTVVGLAIEAVLALADSHLAASDRVGLVELGGVVRWVAPGTGAHQLQRLADALLSTGLFANASERDLTLIPPRALPPRSFVVALTPLLDQRFLDGIHAVRGAGHDVVVIDCLGDAIGAAGDGDIARAAHRLWLAERGMGRDRLGEHGIAVARWCVGEPLQGVIEELNRSRRGPRSRR